MAHQEGRGKHHGPVGKACDHQAHRVGDKARIQNFLLRTELPDDNGVKYRLEEHQEHNRPQSVRFSQDIQIIKRHKGEQVSQEQENQPERRLARLLGGLFLQKLFLDLAAFLPLIQRGACLFVDQGAHLRLALGPLLLCLFGPVPVFPAVGRNFLKLPAFLLGSAGKGLLIILVVIDRRVIAGKGFLSRDVPDAHHEAQPVFRIRPAARLPEGPAEQLLRLLKVLIDQADRGQHTGLLHALFQAALCPAGKPAAAPGRALSGRRAASGKAASAHLS